MCDNKNVKLQKCENISMDMNVNGILVVLYKHQNTCPII
jgi:hypothetical protein